VKASTTKKIVFYIALLLTMWGVHSAAFAQSDRGSITGKVTDNTGALLPGSTITLTNEATGVSQTATPNQSGDYVFQLLNPGSYSLSIAAQGFKPERRTHIVVDVNQANEQNISLNIGAASETIEVNAGGVQQLQTESGSIGLVVEQKSIQELPLVYGNPFTLETLAPGIAVSGVNPNIHSYDSSTATISINGSSLNSLEYRLDGAPDNRIRLSAYTPSSEFINQYKVDTATYDATQGHSSGGFVNTSLKSGTNSFHGGLFGSYQYPNFNASPWKATGPAKNNWLREGGDVGGPIWRNRAFFFTGLEHSRETTPNVLNQTVPTLAERGGDLSDLYALGCSGYTINSSGVAICPNGSVNPNQIYDPTSGHTVTSFAICGGTQAKPNTCVARNPIPNNKITNINPIAAAALKYFPAPNQARNSSGGGNFAYSGAEPNYYYAYIVRLDATLTPNQTIFGHWVQSRRLQPGKNAYFAPVSGTNLTYQNKGVALGYTWTISPSTVLDAHVAWTRFVNQNSLPSQGKLNATSIGMPSYVVNGLPDAANAFPRIDITGYTSLNSDNGVLSHDDISLASIQLSHLFGNHFVRGGFEYRMYNTNAGNTAQSNGRYQNSGTYATASSASSAGSSLAYGLAQFMYGLPNSSAITINADFASRANYMAEWVQDDWKVTPRLTVNLGLRMEYEGPNNERNQKANTYFDFNAVNPASAAAKAAYASIASTNALLLPASAWNVNGGLRFLGDSSTPFGGHQDYQAQMLSFLPRAGFSFEFMPQTVVRGGFGIFDDSLSTFYLSGGNSGSTTNFLLPQQGFAQTTSVSGSGDNGLTFTSTLANPFPNGIVKPTGSALGLSTFLGQSVTFQPTHPKVPYNERWSFGLQRQFGAWLAAVDYVGNHGLHLPMQKEYDGVPQQYLSANNSGYDADVNTRLTTTVSNPFRNVLPSTVSLGSGSTVAVQQLLRPYPEFTGVTAYLTNGTSTYNSLQAQLNRRFTNGASLTSSFTWQKSLDATQYLNSSDTTPWYGISANDRTFRYAMSGIYQFPFGPGRRFVNDTPVVSQIIGGWQVQGVYQIQSGAPLSLNPSTSSIPLYYGGNPAGSMWGKSGYIQNSKNLSSNGNWFDITKWGRTTPTGATGVQAGPNSNGVYYYGNQYQLRTMPIRFNTFRADRLNQLDAAIQRNFSLARLYEAASLQFRFDLINALNHPVYSAPSTDWTSSAFGQITSQGNSPRLYQFEAFVRF
jgi:hypothetical protein